MVEEVLNCKSATFAQKVADNIVHGAYAVDHRIPSERDLSATFQVSRNTVREGLNELFEKGILVRRGRGAFVATDALRIIEGAPFDAGERRVVCLIRFEMYESPIYRTIYEILRDGLRDRAHVEAVFWGDTILPDSFDSEDIVVMFGCGNLPMEELCKLGKKCHKLLLINDNNALFSSIVPDNYEAGRKVGEYLYEAGHRKVGAVLCRPDCAGEFGERYRGVRDELTARGGELLSAEVDDKQPESKIMFDFLKIYREAGATAAVCFKDIAALMLYDAAHQQGIAIPEEMSVVGFDDRCYTANVRPPLSTVRFPSEAIGRKALQSVRALLDGMINSVHLAVPMALLKRDSVHFLAERK